jgi:hypothetical protein
MAQVIVALFGSYHDGDEALRALEALGLSLDRGLLYEAGKRAPATPVPVNTPVRDWRLHEFAVYAAHGERPCASANRYDPETENLGPSPDTASPVGVDTASRNLLVIEDTTGLRPATACEALYDYGALAVKDAAGHWRFSPTGRSAAARNRDLIRDGKFCDAVMGGAWLTERMRRTAVTHAAVAESHRSSVMRAHHATVCPASKLRRDLLIAEILVAFSETARRDKR